MSSEMTETEHVSLKRKQFFFWCILLTFYLFCSFILIQRNYQTGLQSVTQRQEDVLQQMSNQFTLELGNTEKIIRLLYQDVLSNYRSHESSEQYWQSTLTDTFLRFAPAVDHVSQLRWLDKNGMEQVRINAMPNSQVQIVPEDDLQNKSSRYYFQKGIETEYPQIYMSPIDLNIEKKYVVLPYQPTIRISIRTEASQGLPEGILILNYDLGNLLNSLRKYNSENNHVSMNNQEGYWFLNPDPKMEWGHSLDHPEQTLAKLNPWLWEQLKNNNAVTGVFHSSNVYSSAIVQLNMDNDDDLSARTIYFWTQSPYHWHDLLTPLLIGQCLLLLGFIAGAGNWLIRREISNQFQVLQLSRLLGKEKQQLEQTNHQLVRSIEEQKLLQDELVESQKLSSLGMVVAGVAHEINTPTGGALVVVTTLQQQTQTLKEQIQTGLTKNSLNQFVQKLEEGLFIAHNNLEKTATLVTSFKRLAVDRSLEQTIEFPLNDAVNDLILLLKTQSKKMNISLSKDIDESIVMFSYPGILSQVLQNLMMNAIKHAFKPTQQGDISLIAHRYQQDRIEFIVRDNGNGIDESIRNRLFEPFTTTARIQGSTGLGLHLVHQWVTHLLEGSISVNSNNTGTEFRIIVKQRVTSSQHTE